MKKFLLHPLTIYLLKFGGLFSLFYFATLAIIGLSTPENSYSPFVAHYLDYITPLRGALLHVSDFILRLAGYHTQWVDNKTLGLQGGQSIRMVYSCVGYGVLSFWAAFIVANGGTVAKKWAWLVGGGLVLCVLNILRIVILLVTLQHGNQMILGTDHHTLFNIVAYGFIFGMIYFYDKSKGPIANA